MTCGWTGRAQRLVRGMHQRGDADGDGDSRKRLQRVLDRRAMWFVPLLLAACAEGPTTPDFDLSQRFDIERIRQLNAEAKRSGVKVIWVNPPQRPCVTGSRICRSPVVEEELVAENSETVVDAED